MSAMDPISTHALQHNCHVMMDYYQIKNNKGTKTEMIYRHQKLKLLKYHSKYPVIRAIQKLVFRIFSRLGIYKTDKTTIAKLKKGAVNDLTQLFPSNPSPPSNPVIPPVEEAPSRGVEELEQQVGDLQSKLREAAETEKELREKYTELEQELETKEDQAEVLMPLQEDSTEDDLTKGAAGLRPLPEHLLRFVEKETPGGKKPKVKIPSAEKSQPSVGKQTAVIGDLPDHLKRFMDT